MSSMTKQDIIDKIHREQGYSKKEASHLVDLVFDIIKQTLSRGEKVKISGFGNFTIKDKEVRVGRNPQTGESMNISARRVLTFKPSQILKEDITDKFKHRIAADGSEDESIPPKDIESKARSSFNSTEEKDENKYPLY